MDRAVGALLFVPVASILGLMRPMVQIGPSILFEVWGASLWGDLVFILTMAGAFLAGHRLAHVPAASIAVTAAAIWFGYALSWMVTGPAVFDGDTFHLGASLSWVAQFGFVGLGAAFMPWLVGRPRPTPIETPLPSLDAALERPEQPQ